MIEVRQTPEFVQWFSRLSDLRARVQIARRLERAEAGNLGDVVSVGGGVSEMRIFHGPGYRVYFVHRGTEVIVLLGGGDKATQSRDIVAAKRLAKEV